MTHAQNVAAHARKLFARRDLLVRQLAEVDAEIAKCRRSYSDARGYCIALRVESFRSEVAA